MISLLFNEVDTCSLLRAPSSIAVASCNFGSNNVIVQCKKKKISPKAFKNRRQKTLQYIHNIVQATMEDASGVTFYTVRPMESVSCDINSFEWDASFMQTNLHLTLQQLIIFCDEEI